jgi:RNA-directed DNA polymerase
VAWRGLLCIITFFAYGGVISPVLSNLFLHYVFDKWMMKNNPIIPWCRYADDALAHCKTERQAQQLLADLKLRFKECGLELHPGKTKIVYCKDDRRRREYPNTEFDFLGYGFRGREVMNSKTNEKFLGFTPAVSKASLKSMRDKTRSHKIYRRTDMSLNDIAKMFNPILIGWIEYYGRYNRSALYPVLRHFNKTLITWAKRKFGKTKTRASNLLRNIEKREPQLFAHWKMG